MVKTLPFHGKDTSSTLVRTIPNKGDNIMKDNSQEWKDKSALNHVGLDDEGLDDNPQDNSRDYWINIDPVGREYW